MMTVYSQSLLEVQNWFRSCETTTTRGTLYLLIAELMINSTLTMISNLDKKNDFTPTEYSQLLAGLKEKYRGMADADMWREADKQFSLLLNSRPNLIEQFMKELISTNHHGIGMTYNAKDLVSCSYRLRQPADDVIDNLALRSMQCV